MTQRPDLKSHTRPYASRPLETEKLVSPGTYHNTCLHDLIAYVLLSASALLHSNAYCARIKRHWFEKNVIYAAEEFLTFYFFSPRENNQEFVGIARSKSSEIVELYI